MRGALVLALLAQAATASAFVRSRTDKGNPLFWPGGCVWLQPDEAGSQDLSIRKVEAVVAQAIQNWQGPTRETGCSFLELRQDPPAPLEARLDHLNTVKFRRDKWCRPAEGKTPETCFSAQAAAITSLFYTPETGNLVDADIQLNEVNFTFLWLAPSPDDTPPSAPVRPGTLRADLENTLTHEIGHLQGIDHSCRDSATRGEPTDDRGDPVPACSDVLARRAPYDQADAYNRIVASTMFNFAQPGETSKRMIEADDAAAICAIYAAASGPKQCVRPPPVGGCSLGDHATCQASPLVALVTLLACSRGRRRSGCGAGSCGRPRASSGA